MDSINDERRWWFDYNSIQWLVVNYTLPREQATSQPKGWIQGNTKIGPVLEVTTSYLHSKYGVSRSELCLWAETILTHGSESLMDQINVWWIWTITTQKFPKISSKNMRYNWMHRISRPIKGKCKTSKKSTCWALHQESFPWKEGFGSILNQGNISLSEYEVSKKVIHLLRHSQKVHREDDGAVPFCRIKEKSSESIPTIYSLVW